MCTTCNLMQVEHTSYAFMITGSIMHWFLMIYASVSVCVSDHECTHKYKCIYIYTWATVFCLLVGFFCGVEGVGGAVYVQK